MYVNTVLSIHISKKEHFAFQQQFVKSLDFEIYIADLKINIKMLTTASQVLIMF